MYSFLPSGNVIGEFTLEKNAVAAIQKTLRDSDFLSLPDMISKKEVQLHKPDYLVQIFCDGKEHRVNLYDPKDLWKTSESERFMKVWNALFKTLPLKPNL